MHASMVPEIAYFLSFRIAEGVLFVHPQIPLQLCKLLRIPALENAIKETLDTTSEMTRAQEIQVQCFCCTMLSL